MRPVVFWMRWRPLAKLEWITVSSERQLASHRWVVMALALLMDTLFGDLPNRWHPVAWMGSTISAARRHAPTSGAAAQFIYGATVVFSGALLIATVSGVSARLCRWLPQPFGWLLEAFLLKQTLA